MRRISLHILSAVLFYGGMTFLVWKYGWQLPIGIAAVFVGAIITQTLKDNNE